ncbi:MAG: caspase family protein [Ginsengibacter sp.]
MIKKHSGNWKNRAISRIIPGMFFFISALFLSFSAKGQSYFYLENQIAQENGDSVSLLSFLTLNADGSASLRTVSKGYSPPEQLLTDSIFTIDKISNDFKYLVPFYDSLHPDGNTNYKLRFIFKKEEDSSGIFYEPFKTEYADKNEKWIEAKTISEEEKTYASLVQQKMFVRRFFLTSDEFYIYLFGERTRALNVARKEKIFLLVVANTNDEIIGASAKKDFDDINGTITTLSANLGMKLIATRINGINFNKKNVDNALINLKKAKPTKDDIVIFYYSGHGFRYDNDTSPYPRMQLKESFSQKELDHNNLSLEEVYNQILKLGARVSIVLADCCNDKINAQRPIGRGILTGRGVGYNTTSQSLNMDNCNALFFSKEPVKIIASSAQVNQLASGNPTLGGFFTYFFNSFLKKSLYTYEKNDSWFRLLLDAQEKTRWQATSALCGDARCVQLTKMDVIPLK